MTHLWSFPEIINIKDRLRIRQIQLGQVGVQTRAG
jgi:hypothetical protein